MSSEGHLGSSIHNSNLSKLVDESYVDVMLKRAKTDVEGQEVVDEGQTSTALDIGRQW